MIKMLVCDCDGTLVSFGGEYGSSWEAVAKAFSVYENYLALLKEYLPQKDKTEEWTKKTTSLFTGKAISLINNAYPQLPYCPGVEEFFKKNKLKTGILSSGLSVIVKRIQRELSIDFSESTELEEIQGILTGKVSRIFPLYGKGEVLKETAEREKIKLEEICYVGDNFNDEPCFQIAGLGILFTGGNHSRKQEKSSAKYVIQDFRELNKYLPKTA